MSAECDERVAGDCQHDLATAVAKLRLLADAARRARAGEVLPAELATAVATLPERLQRIADALAATADGLAAAVSLPAVEASAPAHGDLLLVEDDADVRELTCILLDSLGWSVTEVGDAREALRLLRQQPFRLVLLDSRLPGGSGSEVARAIRASAGPNQHTPMIGLSASALATERDLGLAAGLSAWLVKPLSRRDAELLKSFCA